MRRNSKRISGARAGGTSLVLRALTEQFLAADPRAPHNVESLYREIIVPASVTDTFAFFADAANLQRITPPWLDFSIQTPMPVEMRAGLEIAYRISLYGLPMAWHSRIDVWEPGVCFVDRQLVGPYRWWRHEHRFEVVHGGTCVIDHVDYAPRVGWLSGALVRRNLQRIFAYRHEVLRGLFWAFGRDKQRRTVAWEESLPCGHDQRPHSNRVPLAPTAASRCSGTEASTRT